MIKMTKMVKKERNQWIRTNHQLMPDHPNMAAAQKMIHNQLSLKMKTNSVTMNLSGQPIKTMDQNHLLEISEIDSIIDYNIDLLHFKLIIQILFNLDIFYDFYWKINQKIDFY